MVNKQVHFEILVEDQSGKAMLDILLPKIIGHTHTFRTLCYKGIGRLPKKSQANNNQQITSHRLLLNNLPKLLQGYGKTYKNNPTYPHKVIVVCDLDNRCKHQFLQQLKGILQACKPQPNAVFCIAVEEGEAWLFGDRKAIEQAYPNAKSDILDNYEADSICNTWELLADAIHSGGSQKLNEKGYPEIGRIKEEWAKKNHSIYEC